MKHAIFCILLITSWGITSSFAQVSDFSSNYQPKWRLTNLNYGLALVSDAYESMSLEDLMVFAENPKEMERDLKGLEEEATPYTGGISLNTSVSLSPMDYATGNYKSNQELRLGLRIFSPKEAMVSYKNKEMDTSIVFCNLHGEVGIDGAYIYKGNLGKRLEWYVGGGINVGMTFANQMILISGKYFEPGEHPSTQERTDDRKKYDAKSAVYSRIYIPHGLHCRITSKFSLGLDFMPGIGLQTIGFKKTNFIVRTESLSFGGRYYFN